MKTRIAAGIIVVLTFAGLGQAGAITNNYQADDIHPFVGLMGLSAFQGWIVGRRSQLGLLA